jgi:hypothetical protein
MPHQSVGWFESRDVFLTLRPGAHALRPRETNQTDQPGSALLFALVAGAKAFAASAVAGAIALAIALAIVQYSPLVELLAPFEMRSITLASGRTISVAVHETSWSQWKACVDGGGCAFLPDRKTAIVDEVYPVTGVNAFDIDEYVAWINRKSGFGSGSRSDQAYRLPTAAEWREIARELPRPEYKKLFSDPRLAWAADYGAMPKISNEIRKSGSFGAFRNGIADLGGNVWEWTSTCTINAEPGRCPGFLVEGLHEVKLSALIREPALGGCTTGVPPPHMGFRLVRNQVEHKGI